MEIQIFYEKWNYSIHHFRKVFLSISSPQYSQQFKLNEHCLATNNLIDQITGNFHILISLFQGGFRAVFVILN